MAFVLKVGSTGDEVKALQNQLVDAGLLPKTDRKGRPNADGVFGLRTRDAVMQFQRTHDLTPDGIVGHQTREALKLPTQAVTFDTAPAPAVPEHIFSPTQLQRIAEIIDALIPTGPLDPFDDAAIAWLVVKIDHAIAGLIPPSILKFIHDATQGIEQRDIRTLKGRLTQSLATRVHLPLLSEETEQDVIGFFVDLLVESLQIGRTVDDALENLKIRRNLAF